MANMIQIDGSKLIAAFKAAGIKANDASRDAGFSRNYFSNCAYYNSISKAAANLLEIQHGIRLEDYVYTEPEPEPTPEPELPVPSEPIEAEVKEVQPVYTPVATLDMAELQQAIALACSHAKAPEIDYDKLRWAIREGMLDAVTQMLSDGRIRNALYQEMYDAHKNALSTHLKDSWNKAKKNAQAT